MIATQVTCTFPYQIGDAIAAEFDVRFRVVGERGELPTRNYAGHEPVVSRWEDIEVEVIHPNATHRPLRSWVKPDPLLLGLIDSFIREDSSVGQLMADALEAERVMA